MVIVELSGGLGNQMFQYAAGRNLAIKNKVPLKLYTHKLKLNWQRSYALKPFNIEENFISRAEIKELIKKNKCTVFTEQSGGFNKELISITDTILLKGYWQADRYFKDIELILRNEFTFKYAARNKNKKLGEEISNTEAIAVHIRRGDFVTVNRAKERYGGVCDLTYYKNSISFIKEIIDNPKFFIFSDDPKWAKENLKPDAPVVYVEHNSTRKHFKLENNFYFRNSLILIKNFFPNKSFEDMRLMILCKHFIIANSSFSWWAAWLGNHPNKIVCAPSRWINPAPDKIETASKEYTDLIPETWIKI
jgi:hypothetical protein